MALTFWPGEIVTACPTTQILQSLRLGMSRQEAVGLLKAQIEQGVALSHKRIGGVEALALARDEKAQWNHATCAVLLRIDPSEQATELFNHPVGNFVSADADFKVFVARFYEEMNERLHRLQTILRRLLDTAVEPAPVESSQPAGEGAASPSIPSVAPPATAEQSTTRPEASMSNNESRTTGVRHSTALVLHASHPTAEKALSEFLSRLGYESVVFGNGSDTHSARESLAKQPASFAVFLATPEEIAAAQDGQTAPSPVCRDMIFELGYFVGKLGDGRTCVVHTGNDAPFQDKFGIPYIPLDALQGWQLQLARHLKRSGIDLDLNRLC